MNEPIVSQAIEALLGNFRQKSRVQASSLITSVFGDAILPRGGRVWLGSLIKLLQPLEINERLIRTTVFRLVKDEWLETEAAGRRTDYMLTPSGRRRFEDASRQIYAAEAPLWDRRWRLIMVVGDLDVRQRERLRRALYWQGFGDTGTGCFIHPSADLDVAFDSLITDGMADLVPYLMPLVAINPKLNQTANDPHMVQRAWNLEALADAYSTFVVRYQPILDALRHDKSCNIDEEGAFLARILLIHDFRRLLLPDPGLPEVLLPRGWPGNHARLLCKEIYRRLLTPSERHLDQCLQLANGDMLRPSNLLANRFQIDHSFAMPD
ncbi:MAG: phenylacetic acid degradation operon negative regulatory protein PaaX [Burkholderiaceae bacterium]|nr:phenylacetic acid degradation operon negative regulatory protein PaaX [Burkholderiaceae bacterium]